MNMTRKRWDEQTPEQQEALRPRIVKETPEWITLDDIAHAASTLPCDPAALAAMQAQIAAMGTPCCGGSVL